LLNWAVRYFPIVRVLKRHVRNEDRILEIGSGSFGLARFYPGPVVGCDLIFPSLPQSNLLPVRCTGTQLPFVDSCFQAVVVSDVLEHVPPDERLGVIREALRVSCKLAVFGFPYGKRAHVLDEHFLEFHRRIAVPPPRWLEEHMLFPFPEEELFRGLNDGWKVEAFGNEHLGFHDWVNRREISRVWSLFFCGCLRIAPSVVEALLRLADRPPFYRMIFVVTRTSNQGK